jgi:hypothetical protein
MALGLASTGVKAYGDYMSALGKGAMYTAEADKDSKMAAAEEEAANVTDYAGGRAAETTGLRYRAAMGRYNVAAAAGNFSGRTTQDVRASIAALGVNAQQETIAKYRETAYQERIRAAGLKWQSGEEAVAAGEARTEGDIAMVGDIASGLAQGASQMGQASSATASGNQVASKWYMLA